MSDVLNRIFGGLALLFWILCFAAVCWQLWNLISTGTWAWITVKTLSDRMFGPLAIASSDSLIVIIAIVMSFSLVMFLGLIAMAFSALAKALE